MVTLGDRQMAQKIDTLEGDDEWKRFYLQVFMNTTSIYFIFDFLSTFENWTKTQCHSQCIFRRVIEELASRNVDNEHF